MIIMIIIIFIINNNNNIIRIPLVLSKSQLLLVLNINYAAHQRGFWPFVFGFNFWTAVTVLNATLSSTIHTQRIPPPCTRNTYLHHAHATHAPNVRKKSNLGQYIGWCYIFNHNYIRQDNDGVIGVCLKVHATAEAWVLRLSWPSR